MRRPLVVLAGMSMTLGLLAGPASAHVITVRDGDVDTHRGAPFEASGPWVGGHASAAPHMGGLNTACHALRATGVAAVDIWGPPGPGGCEHGTF